MSLKKIAAMLLLPLLVVGVLLLMGTHPGIIAVFIILMMFTVTKL